MILLRTLGTIDLRKGELSLATILAQPKRLALLAYLAAARPRGFHSRDRLVALFWPESGEERARNSLRQALHQLRRAIGEDAITGRGDHEVGVDHALVRCDAVLFDEAISAGKWEEALELYQGDFLPGLFVQEAPEIERWIEGERAHRRRQAVEAARKLADRAERAGDPGGATQWARRALELDPDDAAAERRLRDLASRAGEAAGVVAGFDAARGPVAAPAGSSAPVAPSTPAASAVSAVSPASAVSAGSAPAVGASSEPASGRRHIAGWLIAAAVLVIAIAGYALNRTRAATSGMPAQASIAVLPFVNLSGATENDYLSDGMTEELLHLLAQVPGIHVSARTSSFAYKGKALPVDSIGRALRVSNVLEGSVRQSGERVRITAQLIDARTGYHLWSDTFEGPVDDVFDVQDSIGRAIVQSLSPRLLYGADASALPRRREPRDPEAHVSAMKGWRTFRLNTREAYEAASAHFQDAIRRDPQYGYAIAGLATVRHWQANFRHLPPDSAYAEARALAQRALALDSSLVDGWLVLGRIAENVDRDYDRALEYFGRAVAVAPSDARAYQRQAVLLARLGHEEDALRAARRGLELDPASPSTHAGVAEVYSVLNLDEDAEEGYRHALALDPGHPILLRNLANSLVRQQKFDEAERTILEARRRAPGEMDLIGTHAYIAARIGKRDLALALLDTASSLGLSGVQEASIVLTFGDTTRALAALTRAVRSNDDRATVLLDTTSFTALQGLPDYQRLVAEVRGRGGPSR